MFITERNIEMFKYEPVLTQRQRCFRRCVFYCRNNVNYFGCRVLCLGEFKMMSSRGISEQEPRAPRNAARTGFSIPPEGDGDDLVAQGEQLVTRIDDPAGAGTVAVGLLKCLDAAGHRELRGG